MKEVIHVEIELPPCELDFQPGAHLLNGCFGVWLTCFLSGDAFGFVPPNSLLEVNALLERLQLDGDRIIFAKAIDSSKQGSMLE